MQTDAAPPAIPRSLFVIAIFYGGMVCIAGVLGAKQVALGPLAVEAGIFGFILLVVLGSTVAELHGRQTADRLVRIGFVPLITSMLLIQLVLARASTSWISSIEVIKGTKPMRTRRSAVCRPCSSATVLPRTTRRMKPKIPASTASGPSATCLAPR